jgi:hypothetical protein
MLNSRVWDNRVRRLAVGGRVLRLGWFASADPALAIATTDHGDQLDLLVVPPRTTEAAARNAMARAADPTNTMRAPDILAAISAVPDAAAAVEVEVDAVSVWDNEGGQLTGRGSGAGGRPYTPVAPTSRSTLSASSPAVP